MPTTGLLSPTQFLSKQHIQLDASFSSFFDEMKNASLAPFNPWASTEPSLDNSNPKPQRAQPIAQVQRNGRPPKDKLRFDKHEYLPAKPARTLFRKIKRLFNNMKSSVWDELKRHHMTDKQIKEIKDFFNDRSSLYTKTGRPVQLQGEPALISRLCSQVSMGLQDEYCSNLLLAKAFLIGKYYVWDFSIARLDNNSKCALLKFADLCERYLREDHLKQL